MHAPAALPLLSTLARLIRPRPAPDATQDGSETGDEAGVPARRGAGPAAIATARLGPGLPPGGTGRRASADPFVQRLARLH